MNDVTTTKQSIADCLIRAAEKRFVEVKGSPDPYQMAHEQFGIAFVANELCFAGFVEYKIHAELTKIREKAFKAADDAKIITHQAGGS